ncbi:hypothetical protein [Mycolicibacterium sp.]|uniref:hypothetical protein n=1 Tax=Mycolicibacterium sp. TaxID=2320850 RepID=UPI00355D42F2
MTIPGSTRERPEWRDWPELHVVAPSTSPDTAGIPAHVEGGPQARYAHPSTVNHQRWRDEHCGHMATAAAPGLPIPRRRRMPPWLRADLEALAAVVVILALVILIYWLLSNLPRIAVA